MTTTLGRWPRWALGLALATWSGCGQPPPMVTMAPPGSRVDPLAVDLSDESLRAKAVGETPIAQRKDRSASAGADDSGTAAAAASATSPPLEPTEPGEEIVTDSGLAYSTIEPGDPSGTMAEVGDTISVRYTGTLEDGTVFDSNMDRAPIDFPLAPGGLIRGWIEGIPGMRVGERRRLAIPSALGYGSRGSPPTIPPDAPLTFEVVLVDVRKGG